MIQERLVFWCRAASQGANGIGHDIEPASLPAEQGRESQVERLRIIWGDLAVEREGEIGLS